MVNSLFDKRYNWILIALLLFGIWSCSDDNGTEAPEAGYITLQVNVGNATTRATADGENSYADGENSYNENAINSVDIFFFPNDANDNTPAVKAGHFTPNTTSEATCKIKISLDDVATLFNNGTTCTVYAVVNCAATKSLSNPTKNELNQTPVGVESATGGFNTNTSQKDFVMYGTDDNITYNKETNSATGTIQVSRVAAKIRIAAHIENVIYQSTEDGTILSPNDDETQTEFEARMAKDITEGKVKKWTPQLTNMQAYITNGVNNARLDGKFSDEQGGDLLDKIYYFPDEQSSATAATRRLLDPTKDYTGVTKPSGLPASPTDGDITFTYYNWLPFYTYPNSWENSEAEDRRTYLTIVVPWRDSEGTGNTEYQSTYYQVPIGRESNEILSNHYYRIRMNIGVIGSFTVSEPVELEASYDIMPWGKEELGVDIKNYRYLVVNQTEWDLNGEESITIPFYSSHDVEVVDVKVTYYNFNDTWTGRQYAGQVHERTFGETENNETKKKAGNDGDGVYSYSVDNTANTLTFTHPLIGWDEYRGPDIKISNEYANYAPEFFKKNGEVVYSKYDIKITIRHTDQDTGTRFEETITIHQTPSIYIETEYNTSPFSTNEYIFVNGRHKKGIYNIVTKTDQGKKYQGWNECMVFTDWDVQSTDYSENQNPNMYIITVTQLSPSDEDSYIIGDPRTLNINNFLYGNDAITDKEQLSPWLNDAGKAEAGNAGTGNTTFGGNEHWQSKKGGKGNEHGQSIRENFYDAAVSAIALHETDKRRLAYYYPTDEQTGTGSKEKFLAPKFRVASSFAKSGPLTREEARRRCAGYQEFGYPAGRWRIPTLAEYKYICTLSAKKLIPLLFNLNTNYWTAQGIYSINEQGVASKANNQTTETSVRCVYDEWYWMKEDGTADNLQNNNIGLTTFVWGDKPKDNPQETRMLLRKATKGYRTPKK